MCSKNFPMFIDCPYLNFTIFSFPFKSWKIDNPKIQFRSLLSYNSDIKNKVSIFLHRYKYNLPLLNRQRTQIRLSRI